MDATSLRKASFHLLSQEEAIQVILAIRANRRAPSIRPTKAVTRVAAGKKPISPEKCIEKFGISAMQELIRQLESD